MRLLLCPRLYEFVVIRLILIAMDSALTLNSVVSQSKRCLCGNLLDGLAIINIDNRCRFSLDAIGARIWTLLGQPIIIDDVVKSIVREFDVSREKSSPDTLNLLNELLSAELIVVRESLE